MEWTRLSQAQIRQRVFDALARNRKYTDGTVLGFPGSFLDREVFPPLPFVLEQPFLNCFRENPNHIGCHTYAEGEGAFAGTHDLERDAIRICAEGLFGAQSGEYDGYIASGGTECNIEAVWIQRNRLRAEGVRPDEMRIVHSEDTHYSAAKASDLLCVPQVVVPVDEITRRIDLDRLRDAVTLERDRGVRHLIVFANLGTTMFGSIDDPDEIARVLEPIGVPFSIHVDAAFGGFIAPLVADTSAFGFRNPRVASITVDGHKMLQAPFGTGVFLARKGLMQHVCTREAEYVHGRDYTLCGSRSGANAVAVWMILRAYGREGAEEFVRDLLRRTQIVCEGLDRLGVRYFRDPRMNIITMRSEDVPAEVATKYGLVPDRHEGAPRWWKMVVMDHVESARLNEFLDEVRRAKGERLPCVAEATAADRSRPTTAAHHPTGCPRHRAT